MEQQARVSEQASVFLCNRVAANLMMGSFLSAAVDCEAAIGLNPSYVKAHLRFAKALIGLGKCDQAREHLEAAVAGVVADEKERTEAGECLRRVESFEGNMIKGKQILSEGNDDAKALQYFDAAKALAPSGLEARLFEVACLLAMGGATGLDNDKGRSSLAKGMDLLKVLGKVADVVEAHSARALLGFAMSCGESLLRRGLSTQADRFLTSALGLSNGDADAQ